jgi:hypothetical protein
MECMSILHPLINLCIYQVIQNEHHLPYSSVDFNIFVDFYGLAH